ncbi:hypothetical protein FIU89_19450 [Roseovarius sp. THAF27]|uniref:Hint domain-containing protein n=1 Tax=Roseovarius sp. THAF27 TaxID=2587850 RepID=UPI0012688120|nr:Hint domain-containing protein [Roseovarius sp. THAF27]QFT82807.1 hypothetical protein FIU89_19450 [Roseovarius sp. THAF27]
MTKTFYGIDNEFAVATGSNVNDSPGQSSFDYPPNSSRDLIVTSNAGDSDPNLFELGETYDVQYSGPGGTHLLDDAVVIRSDPAPGDGGIIVFEGANGNGDPAQVVWSPDFDLETWYFDNFTNGQPPKFFASDQNTSYTHTVNCFAAGTLLETPSGPRPVEHLRPNDRVLTRNDGARRILWTGARTMPGDGPACPVRFVPGILGNTRPLRLSQQHRVAIRSWKAELLFGTPEVLVPAKALVGQPGITFAPCRSVTYVHLLLEDHQLVLAEGGAPCETILPGVMTEQWLIKDAAAIHRAAGTAPYRAALPILTYREARCVVGTRGVIRPPAAVLF